MNNIVLICGASSDIGIALIKSIREECLILALAPSMIETQFLSEIDPRHIEIAAAANPLKRNAVPADIIPAINFLLSPESGFINGATIPITGGSTI